MLYPKIKLSQYFLSEKKKKKKKKKKKIEITYFLGITVNIRLQYNLRGHEIAVKINM